MEFVKISEIASKVLCQSENYISFKIFYCAASLYKLWLAKDFGFFLVLWFSLCYFRVGPVKESQLDISMLGLVGRQKTVNSLAGDWKNRYQL